MAILSYVSSFELEFMIIAVLLIVLDVLTGIMKGFATKSLSSEKMRLGFWHKSANITLLILSYGATIARVFIDTLPEWTSGIYIFVASYIAIMELTSVLENLTEINPELNAKLLFSRFGINKDEKEEDE